MHKFNELREEEKSTIINVPKHILEGYIQKPSNVSSDCISVENHIMQFGKQKLKVKYTGVLVNKKMSGKGTVKSLDDDYPEGASYEGEVYDGKKHGKGTDIIQAYDNGDYIITKYEGEYQWDKKHGNFKKICWRLNENKEPEETTQEFSYDVPHAYSSIIKDRNEVYQFKVKSLEDKEKYITLNVKKDGSVTLVQNVTNKIAQITPVRPALASTEKKNGEGMDDK